MTLNEAKTILTDDSAIEHDVVWLVREKKELNDRLANPAISGDEETACNARLSVVTGLIASAKSLGRDTDALEAEIGV